MTDETACAGPVKNPREETAAPAAAVPFCTCADTACPNHPASHGMGCTPCILKNLKAKEIPSCFFHAAGGVKPTPGWHFEDFAQLINSLNKK